ncbi:probable cytochrome P450 9f2 [Phlebotomus argentipes]|uniref:probable cytochrome P450 9f2 n=1 Tax=Phlebotomus argentipes TaxID=94469 RepID=UPI0028930B4B|nr:probable cytochrome P450 9f2 [Phlebotomus argentipes]
MALWLLPVFVLFLWVLYKYGFQNEFFFRDRGVKFIKPLPFFGSSLPFFTNKENLIDFALKLSKKYRNEKVFGVFDLRTPILVIQDPELVKYLSIKEFDHFTDHQILASKDVEPLFSQSLFSLEGQKWREMRATLSPAFTGSKMRLMCDFMVEICEQMVDYLKTEAKEKGPQTHEVKEFFSRIATDIIGTCAFGIKVDSLKEKDNKFFTSAKEMFNTTSITLVFKLVAARVCPLVMKLFGISIFDEKYRGFLKDLVLNNMKTRQEKNIIRPDMIHLLIEAQKGTLENTTSEKDSAGFATAEESQTKSVAKKTSWTDDEIVSQCFIFFLAGFDTISTVLTFAAYEIAKNTEVQEKLYQEAKTFRDELKGRPLKYETVQKMKYLDMIISETLRVWPAVSLIDRMCTKDFTMEYEPGKKYTFRKGELYWIPIGDFHFNPEYFPDPNKFDPERFSDENKHLINPNTYLPFGIGPRNCIGSRFALMEVKSLIFYLIINFHFDLSDKTEDPLILAGSAVGLKARNGVWIKFRPRE